MKLAIMQPYLFPYIGYFQLMQAVDEMLIYDNIQFSKKGWINRNRILINGHDEFLSFPLKKDSDYMDVNQRQLSGNWPEERRKTLNKIKEVYKKAPYFYDAYPVIEEVLLFDNCNLFQFIFNSLQVLQKQLNIKTKLVITSTIDIDHSLKSENKVIALCKKRNASVYINPIGGLDLYKKEHFLNEGIELFFLKTGEIRYTQFNHEFVPYLSIIDIMMFNSKENIKDYLDHAYQLI